MKKAIILILVITSPQLFAQKFIDTHLIFTQLGAVYEKTEGKCEHYFGVIKWAEVKTGKYETVSFTLGSHPPLRNNRITGNLILTVDKNKIVSRGSGKPYFAFNQGQKIISEYEQLGQDLTIYLNRKGKRRRSCRGGFYSGCEIIPKENLEVKLTFSQKNVQGIFEAVEVEYKNKKNIFKKIFSKKKICKYQIP